jgi:uncharacterized protein (TIGR02453 family)
LITQSTLQFLNDLHKNNTREWYHANKDWYKEAFGNFEDLVAMLLHTISDFDTSVMGTEPKDCLFRIYRDIRFSKDKTPYKTWFGAAMKSGGRKQIGSGYYIHVSPKQVYLAGGIWHPEKDTLDMIRDHIVAWPKKIERVVTDKNFIESFGELGGDQLKTAPRGFPKDHPQIQWLRHKDLIVSTQVDPKLVLSETFIQKAGKIYEKMLPLNQFITEAIS